MQAGARLKNPALCSRVIHLNHLEISKAELAPCSSSMRTSSTFPLVLSNTHERLLTIPVDNSSAFVTLSIPLSFPPYIAVYRFTSHLASPPRYPTPVSKICPRLAFQPLIRSDADSIDALIAHKVLLMARRGASIRRCWTVEDVCR